MSHDCSALWMMPDPNTGAMKNPILELKMLLNQVDNAFLNVGYDLGGWAYWITEEAQFLALGRAFDEVCGALETPVIPAGHWVGNPTTVGPMPFQPGIATPPGVQTPNQLPFKSLIVRSLHIGTYATMVPVALKTDGEARGNHPFFGVHGWMKDGNADPVPLQQLTDLFEALRNALDR